MKVNLIMGGKAMSGYLNIDPHGFGEDNKVIGEINNLDEYVGDAEATEILALDIINYLPIEEVEEVISNWISKLRHGGKIVIGGKDILSVSKIFAQGAINLVTVNKEIFGENDVLNKRKSHITLRYISELLKVKGLKILKKRINGTSISVEAIRE